MNKDAIFACNTTLTYCQEYADLAVEYANKIKDPELTQKLKDLQNKIPEIKQYILGKTDPKTFG